MTGNVARIGDELASRHLWLAARSGILVLCFLAGAAVSTLLILHGNESAPGPTGAPCCSNARCCSPSQR